LYTGDSSMELAQFYGFALFYIKKFNAWAGEFAPNAVADHICYKCSSSREFEDIRQILHSEVEFEHTSLISGRQITLLKLKRPLPTDLGGIQVVELCDQKPDGRQQSGFAHIEIYSPGRTAHKLAEELVRSGVKLTLNSKPHRTTYEIRFCDAITIRIEDEPLMATLT